MTRQGVGIEDAEESAEEQPFTPLASRGNLLEGEKEEEEFVSASKFFAQEDAAEVTEIMPTKSAEVSDNLREDDVESIPDADEELEYLQATSGTRVEEADFEKWAYHTVDPDIAAKVQAKALERIATLGEGSPGEYLVARSAPLGSAQEMIQAYGRFASPEANCGGDYVEVDEEEDDADDEHEEEEEAGGGSGMDLAGFCITDELVVDSPQPTGEEPSATPVGNASSASSDKPTSIRNIVVEGIKNRRLSQIVCHSPHPGAPTLDSPVIKLKKYETPRGSTLHPDHLDMLKRKFEKPNRTFDEVNSTFQSEIHRDENINASNAKLLLHTPAEAASRKRAARRVSPRHPPHDIILACKLGASCSFEVPVRNAGGDELEISFTVVCHSPVGTSPFSVSCDSMVLDSHVEADYVVLTFRPTEAAEFSGTLRMVVRKRNARTGKSIVDVPIRASSYEAQAYSRTAPLWM